MNEQKLKLAIQTYMSKKKNNAEYYIGNWNERKERKTYYQSFNKSRLIVMTKNEFLEYISKLWSMIFWGNKKYIVDKLVTDNGFEKIKKQLVELLYGNSDIEKRWDNFLKNIKGIGPATISELLTYINPKEYAVLNKTTILCYTYLGIPHMPKYNYQYTGQKYVEVCKIAKQIGSMIADVGEKDADLLAVDYFLWNEILPFAEKNTSINHIQTVPGVRKKVSAKDTKSLHDEIKEKLIIIGELLGFESRAEVRITVGCCC